MDEGETKTCTNCKREIPAVNFMIHSVHCARNIKMCPVCKEPVPHTDLENHHAKFHELLPCKKCGESVCGTDMEDHIRDSCALTMQSCRFCSLELMRQDVPSHERYCGTRTEQCPDCSEFIQLRYRALHVESNHGFIRLNDDPPPCVKKPISKPKPPEWAKLKPDTPEAGTSSSNGQASSSDIDLSSLYRIMDYQSAIRDTFYAGFGDWQCQFSMMRNGLLEPRAEPPPEALDRRAQRTSSTSPDKSKKDGSVSRGAVKKRPAPRPPARPAHGTPQTGPPLIEEERQEITRQLIPSTGIKLRESRAKNKANEAPKASTSQESQSPGVSPTAPNTGTPASPNSAGEETSEASTIATNITMPFSHFLNLPRSMAAEEAAALETEEMLKVAEVELAREREQLRNATPMSPDQFLARISGLQLDDPRPARPYPPFHPYNDRISAIKSSLTELRRELKQVTATYNNNNTIDYMNANEDNDHMGAGRRTTTSPVEMGAAGAEGNEEEEVEEEGAVGLEDPVVLEVPCDLCQVLQPASRLLEHEAACGGGRRARDADAALIPCQFCGRLEPYYLITTHQANCFSAADLLFPD